MATDPYNTVDDERAAKQQMRRKPFVPDPEIERMLPASMRSQAPIRSATNMREDFFRTPEEDLVAKPVNYDGPRQRKFGAAPPNKPAPIEPKFVDTSKTPRGLNRRTIEGAGLTRVVRTAPGVYTNLPGAEGEERFYDAMGSRADKEFVTPGEAEGRSMTPGQFFERQRGSARADNETILQRGENAMGIRRRMDEEVMKRAAQEQAMMQLAITKKTPEQIQAEVGKLQSEGARNVADAGKTVVDTRRADFDAERAAELAKIESAQFDPLAADREAIMQNVFGDDPAKAARIARQLGFDSIDEAADVLAFERGADSQHAGSLNLNKSATAARAVGIMQRELGGRVDNATSFNPFDKRRLPGNHIGRTGGRPNLAALRFDDAMYEQGDGFYLEHAPEGTDSRAAFMTPGDGGIFGNRERLQRLLASFQKLSNNVPE